MKTKVLEIRDEATCIPAVAILMWPWEWDKLKGSFRFNAVEDRFLWRSGYPRPAFLDATEGPKPGVILIKMSSVEAQSDPYHWSYARTMREAHVWIIEHFTELKDGDVIDVRVILGEAEKPADPEIWTKEKADVVS